MRFPGPADMDFVGVEMMPAEGLSSNALGDFFSFKDGADSEQTQAPADGLVGLDAVWIFDRLPEDLVAAADPEDSDGGGVLVDDPAVEASGAHPGEVAGRSLAPWQDDCVTSTTFAMAQGPKQPPMVR